MSNQPNNQVEPWLRGTHPEIPAIPRQVLHALELAREDAERWCVTLTEDELEARPYGIAPVAFHLRHIARSLDRLLTYAEGNSLDESQLEALRAELVPAPGAMAEFTAALPKANTRILVLENYEQTRTVGRAYLPTTVGGLLVHCAEHTQRHAGQLVTTARVVMGLRA